MEFNTKNLDKKNKLHHFNIVEGGDRDEVDMVCSKIFGVDCRGNKNYFYEKYQEFKILDARRLINLQNLKHKTADVALYIIDCDLINVAAQNALLKICEETALGNYFFFIVSESKNLLPTFLSRAEIFQNFNQQILIQDFDYFKLKSLSIKDRMNLVNKIISDIKKERIAKSGISSSINYLLKQMHAEILKGDKSLIQKLDSISSVANHLGDNGASIKSILEFTVINI